jgi:general secretion pathway protein G
MAMFELDTGRYPTTAEGVSALLTAPAGVGRYWTGPYIRAMPEDDWGHPFQYVFPSPKDPTTYQVISWGPDGVPGTADDIIVDGPSRENR